MTHANALQGVSTTEPFNNSLTLDKGGNYLLFWNFNSTHVTFEVRVKTRGYVGFGLSPNGNMFPSDVVVGWVKDGKVFFKDRHTTGHSAPVVDKSQDWILLHGEENDFGTVLKFTRKLNTCDKDDIEINNATQRVIYSYHPDDPTDEHSLMYHGGERRGTKSVSLLNSNKAPASVNYEETKVYDFTAGNYIVPDKDTTYMCVAQTLPDLGAKHHVIQFEPIITPGNERLIHHLVIQRCKGDFPNLNHAQGECFLSWPKGWPVCSEIFIAWATGGGPFYFPENTGYPIGGPNDNEGSLMVMQIHYDNPTHKSGILDNSGIRMLLTPKLRQHDVGSLIVSHSVTPYQVIPPREPAFVTSGYCTEKCINKVLNNESIDEIRITAVFQHAHLLASGIRTRHFRNGTELKPIYDDPNYDFYFQEMRPLKEEVVIKKGDSMRVDCIYNSLKRSEPSFGGLSTREEMCESIMYYYPRTDLFICGSVPDMNTMLNTSFQNPWDGGPNSFKSYIRGLHDWTNSTQRDVFKQQLRHIQQEHECTVFKHDGSNPYGGETWTYEEHETDYVKYVPPTPECGTGN